MEKNVIYDESVVCIDTNRFDYTLRCFLLMIDRVLEVERKTHHVHCQRADES